MKRIVIATLPGYFNYGNRLQAYALACVLKREGPYEVEYVVPLIERNTLLRLVKNFILAILKRNPASILIKIRKEQAILPFSKQYLHEVTPRDGRGYFCGIVGSDQVWHPAGIKTRNFSRYFLTMVSPERRIAYAPSFGLSTIPKDKEEHYKEYLPQFSHISTRESSGAALVEGLTGRKVPIVLDPTLLLTAEEWGSLTSEFDQQLNEKKYIVRYTLGRLSEKDEKQLKEYAASKNLEIYQIMGDSMESGGIGEVPSVPEFLSLIKNADAVFTDSFHACVFATIFHTPFVALKRPGVDMSTRISTLLGMTGMDANLDSGDVAFRSIIEQSDFSGVDLKIELQRTLSANYLRDALNAVSELDGDI